MSQPHLCPARHQLLLAALAGLLVAAAAGAQTTVFADDSEAGSPWAWSYVENGIVDYLHPNLVDQSRYYTGGPADCSRNPPPPNWTAPFLTIDPASLRPGAVVAMFVNVHIERSTNYSDPAVFAEGVAELEAMAAIFAAHGAKLTVNVQDPFLDLVVAQSHPILATLVAGGHALGVHFHETEQLGPGANSLPPATWAARLSTMKAAIEAAGGPGADARAMSGGNQYPDLLTAMALAGMDIKLNYKSPTTQLSVPAAATTSPYYPGGWGSASALLRGGGDAVVFLPGGVAPLQCTSLGGVDSPISSAPFDYVTTSLRNTLDAAVVGKIQVFGIVFSLNRLTPALASQQEGLWARWFTEVLDPLAAAGALRYTTANQLADEVAAAVVH